MLNKTKNRKLGFFSASGVAIGQGMEGILFQFLFIAFAVKIVENNAFGTAVMAFKETLSIFLSLLIFGPSLFWTVIKKFKQKQSWYFIAASMFGTSVGNILYILAVAQAGSSYGVILTAMYPIFSMLLIKFLLREKENWKVWLGAFITVVSGILFLFLPTVFDSKEGFTGKRFFGMILGLFSALFWAVEGIFLKKGMNLKLPKGVKHFTNSEIVVTRNIFSCLSTYVIIIPIMFSFGNTFTFLNKILFNWQAILIVSSISVNIIILRIMHIHAIDSIGPKLTATIDTNNFLVPTLLAEILQFIPIVNSNNQPIFEPVIWWAYLLIIPIAIGVAMVVYFNEDKEPEIIFEKSLE